MSLFILFLLTYRQHEGNTLLRRCGGLHCRCCRRSKGARLSTDRHGWLDQSINRCCRNGSSRGRRGYDSDDLRSSNRGSRGHGADRRSRRADGGFQRSQRRDGRSKRGGWGRQRSSRRVARCGKQTSGVVWGGGRLFCRWFRRGADLFLARRGLTRIGRSCL